MTNRVFLDTSYLLAMSMVKDQNHESARKHWRRAARLNHRFSTTSFILDETVTFLNSRGFHRDAVNLGEMLLTSRAVEVIHVEQSLFHEGWDYFKQHRDKRFSLTDCISFVVMKNFDIKSAFAFDRHFDQAGFTTLP